jgi:hypothetical protein
MKALLVERENFRWVSSETFVFISCRDREESSQEVLSAKRRAAACSHIVVRVGGVSTAKFVAVLRFVIGARFVLGIGVLAYCWLAVRSQVATCMLTTNLGEVPRIKGAGRDAPSPTVEFATILNSATLKVPLW